MAVELLGIADVTDVIQKEGSETASISDVYSLLVRERQYRISDPNAQYNPFANGALFNVNSWRNGSVIESEATGVIRVSAINDVGFSYTEQGKETFITARDSFGVLKDWVVEELLLKSENSISQRYTMFAGQAAQFNGLISLNNSGSPLNITVGDIVSFNPDAVPRYQVTEVTAGTPTPSIRLDRPLEFSVPINAILRVMSPVVKTGPKAIKDALIAAGVVNIGPSFDVLNASDTLANLNLRLFTRTENKVKLTDHLTKILDMTDLFLTINEFDQIDIFRGLQWDGLTIPNEITGAERMLPIRIPFEKSKIYWAYDCAYDSAGKVAIKSATVTSTYLQRFAATDRWQPIPVSSAKPLDYTHLYANEASAGFFGARRILYNGVPRARFSTGLKPYPSGRPYQPYKLSLGNKFTLTMNLGGGRSLTREPAAIIGYTLDKNQQYYSNVLFELTNWIYPGLPII